MTFLFAPARLQRSEGFHLVAVCSKAFLHVHDEGCHHQHFILILVWPSSLTFHPSRVNEPTLDPNWPPLQRGCLLSRAEGLKFRLWNRSWPASTSSPWVGNQKAPNANKRSSGSGPRPHGRHIKTHVPPVLLHLEWTPFQTGHWRNPLHFIKLPPTLPQFLPVNKFSEQRAVCSLT